MQVQKQKKEGKKKIMQEYMRKYMRKKSKRSKNYTQALRGLKCAYTKKNVFSLELNTAILEAF